jgi:hypothetical protein
MLSVTRHKDKQIPPFRLMTEAADRECPEVGVVVAGHPFLALSDGGDDAANGAGHADTNADDGNGAPPRAREARTWALARHRLVEVAAEAAAVTNTRSRRRG